jgi:hypothetical protein
MGITQLSDRRVAQETALVHLKMQEIQADMQRLNTYAQLYHGRASNPQTLEDMLQAVYETRGRQAFGRFYGETTNAV